MPNELDLHVSKRDDGFYVVTCAQYPGLDGFSAGLLGAIDALVAKIVELG